MKKNDNLNDLTRRDFLRGGSLTTLMMLAGGVPILADEKSQSDPDANDAKAHIPPVTCALIGCGFWGREILKSLASLPIATVAGICDVYEPYLHRSHRTVPQAEPYQDYRKLLDRKDIKAVIIATPTPDHREIALAALQAGKHVYCEAPLANTIPDARAIAAAAKAAGKQYFQSGLQYRADPQRKYLLQFIRTGVMGTNIEVRSQWHNKSSWRHTSPNAEQEKRLNWRLHRATSLGLTGEVGIHQVDVANWYLLGLPLTVTGFGSLINWRDGRDVNDTVRLVLEYPQGVLFTFDGTLANSFDAEYDLYYGTESTIMWRDRHAWEFKEADSPLLGWEVYARKDTFYKESGIVLDANATKQKTALSAKKTQNTVEDPINPLQHSLIAFLTNSSKIGGGVDDFTANFGDDPAGIKDYLNSLAKDLQPAAGYKEGYESAVTVIKATEAVRTGKRIAYSKEWFALS